MGRNLKETGPFSESVSIVYNGSGDELHLPGRYLLRNGNGEPYATIRGTFLAVGVYNGSYISLTDAQIMCLQILFIRDSAAEEKGRSTNNLAYFPSLCGIHLISV